MFYFSFRSFRKIFFPHPYPLALAVNKSPAVFIVLSRALDKLRKENRGSVDRLALHLLKNDEMDTVSKNKVTNPEKYVALLHDSSLCTRGIYK